MDCGPTCLRMIASFYGREVNGDLIRNEAGYGKDGVNMLGITKSAENIGFKTMAIRSNLEDLLTKEHLPCIIHWNHNHFVVVVKSSRSFIKKELTITVADPSKGILYYKEKDFLEQWASAMDDRGQGTGHALLIEPTKEFYNRESAKKDHLSWAIIFGYLKQNKSDLAQVLFAMLVTSLLQLAFPFLTQSIVDTGISTQNLSFITIILIAQLMLVFSRTLVDFIRGRLLMTVSILINISILSDFWIKLTRLPISYFDTYHTGDTMQRISDNKQLQTFLTSSAITTLFSVFNFIVYTLLLLNYSFTLFLIFTIGATIYFFWVKLFLKVRRRINYQSFHLAAKENNASLQLVQGMQEIRMNNAENIKRWEWENAQTGIFKLNIKNLSYSQIQQAGALLINQGKDVFITFLVAKLVIDGQLTIGVMLAIQYIVGQLNGPIDQWIGFIQSAQDAKISLERLNEIHAIPDEEDTIRSYIEALPLTHGITLKNVDFSYPGMGNQKVLDSISLHIPEGKTTAIVGTSGSGKTTLLKILLRVYDTYTGEVLIGDKNILDIRPSFWRSQCGTVLQDGYIFNDSIAKNIAVRDYEPDKELLVKACKVANILNFIESLPNHFNTQLGALGINVSEGQKQRILIARAVYRNPKYLLFDEATNALDSNNEKSIVENLSEFSINRTVIVVAHRLSTVKHADKIVVLDNGKIAEEGTHQELTEKKGKYFQLVKNQLELGS